MIQPVPVDVQIGVRRGNDLVPDAESARKPARESGLSCAQFAFEQDHFPVFQRFRVAFGKGLRRGLAVRYKYFHVYIIGQTPLFVKAFRRIAVILCAVRLSPQSRRGRKSAGLYGERKSTLSPRRRGPRRRVFPPP